MIRMSTDHTDEIQRHVGRIKFSERYSWGYQGEAAWLFRWPFNHCGEWTIEAPHALRRIPVAHAVNSRHNHRMICGY